jgi:lipopolysaccharide export system protein LptC
MFALALLTFWLDRVVREEVRHPSLRRHDPDYIVDRFSITNYDRAGRTESHLSADRMLHYPDDDTTEIVKPQVVYTKAEQPRLVLTAERGALSQDGDEVFLYGDVLLVRDASADRPEMRVRSEFLHLLRDRSVVVTDRPVSVTEPRRSLSASAMEYNNETRELLLAGQARGDFAPAANRSNAP